MSRPFDIVQYEAFNVHTFCLAAVLSLYFHIALKRQAVIRGFLSEKYHFLEVAVAVSVSVFRFNQK